jgi:hypothetical protein
VTSSDWPPSRRHRLGFGKLLLATCAATALVACDQIGASPGGSSTTASPTTSPPTAPTASPSFTAGEKANLSQADDGTTIHVHAGAAITVGLGALPGARWSPPRAADPSVLATKSSRQDPDGGASGEFRALAPGTAELNATNDPNCLPQCGRASRLWRVTVVVDPHPVP